MKKSLLGIDIGSHELKIARWEGNTVTKFYCAEVPDSLVKGDVITSYDAAADFIKEVVAQNKIGIKDCAVVLPSSLTYIRRVSMPYIEKEKIPVNLPYEFHDFINEDKSKYSYAYEINDTIYDENNNPEKYDITAAAVMKEVIENYKAMLSRAGLRLVFALPAEQAISNLINYAGDFEGKGYCILDIGHNTSRLDIYDGTKYETTRVIDMGLAELDRVIAEKENVDQHFAHTYKENNYNDLIESEDAVKIYGRIANDVRKSINFYGLSNRNVELKDIYLAGGGCSIKKLSDTIEEATEAKMHLAEELYSQIAAEAANKSSFDLAVGAVVKPEGMNLAVKEKSNIDLKLAIPLVALILAVIAVFAKTAIIDRYDELANLEDQVFEQQVINDAMINNLADYKEVEQSYNTYSKSWMTIAEQERVTRQDMFELIDRILAKYGRIMKLKSSENIISAEIAGVTLSDSSDLVSELYEQPNVKNVSISEVTADKYSYEQTVEVDGKKEVQTIFESSVTITIDLIKEVEEEK